MPHRLAVILVAVFLNPLLARAATQAPWYPVKVVSDGRAGSYQPLARAGQAWRICALLPHARDKYFWGVSWGLTQEAERLGVKLGIYQAGGYDYLPVQRKQFQDCLDKGADAILLAAISTDGLNDDIAVAARRGVPVIDLITGISSELVAARSLVKYDDAAAAAAQYLLSLSGKKPVNVAWLPGPKDAGWVKGAEAGMYRSFQQTSVTVQHTGYGPPELGAQMGLIRAAIKAKDGGPDYFLGNAVACEAAANFIRYNPHIASKIIAFYATEPVVDLIRQGRVLAAASDSPVLQARISVDLAVRVLEKQPYARRVGPAIDMIDAKNVYQYDFSRIFAPGSQRITQQALPD